MLSLSPSEEIQKGDDLEVTIVARALGRMLHDLKSLRRAKDSDSVIVKVLDRHLLHQGRVDGIVIMLHSKSRYSIGVFDVLLAVATAVRIDCDGMSLRFLFSLWW